MFNGESDAVADQLEQPQLIIAERPRVGGTHMQHAQEPPLCDQRHAHKRGRLVSEDGAKNA